MTRLALLLLACQACTGATQGSRAPEHAGRSTGASVHHDISMTLAPDERRLMAEDVVTLSPELRARLGDGVEFSLHAGLSPGRVGPGAPLRRLQGIQRARPGVDEQDAVPTERYRVELAKGEQGFTIRFGGEIFHAVDHRGEELAHGMAATPGIISADGVLLSGASAWLPDLATGTVTFTLEAHVPVGWDVVSQGARTRHEREDRGTVVRWESPDPQEEVFLVAGPFVERSRRSGRVILQTFLRSDDADLSDPYLTAGGQYLSMYSALLGRYPYPKFALVENFWETGYGMPSFTLLGPRILRFPFILHTSYPHEILHDWWGNGVFVEPSRGNWSEGLTAYLADHLIKEQQGEGAEYRRSALQRYADYVAASQDLAVREFRARHGSVTEAVGYDKVLMVFHMLRLKLGDARFITGLRTFYEAWRFRAASFDDLGRAFGRAASEDLAPWLAQWLDRPGAPSLRLSDVSARRRGAKHLIDLTLAQVQAGAPYDLDVPVYVTMAGRPDAVPYTVHLASARHRFTLEIEAEPMRVDVDPAYDVFRRLDPAELPPSVGGAFGATDGVFILPSSAPSGLRRAYEALAASWRKPGMEIVSDADLARLPVRKAVWVLGWENRFRETVARGLQAYGGELTADAFRVGKIDVSARTNSVALAVRNADDAAGVIVFVAAADPRALSAVGRKLPHYGKYGLVAFEGPGASKVATEIWPVPISPLTAVLQAGGSPAARGALPPRSPLAPIRESTAGE